MGAENLAWGRSRRTALIDIILACHHFLCERACNKIWLFSDDAEALGQDLDFVPRDVVTLDCFGDDALRFAVGVIGGRVPLQDG